LLPGASEPSVLADIDRLLEPYGGLGAYGREDQVSHRFLDDKMKQLRGMGMIVPAIFLGVAAFLLNVVLSRLIGTQREQIAALKAFGYTHGEVGLHYLKMVLVLALVGGAVGIVIGIWMGKGITALYTQFYHFPVFTYIFESNMAVLALLISGGAAILGALGAVRRAVRLPPAEALRPEPPATFRPTILERLGLQALFSQPVRMILRQLERRPFKAALSCLAIAFSGSILILGSFSQDALYRIVEIQFGAAERENVTISFAEPRSYSALYEVQHLPGVLRAEPFRSVPIRLRSEHLTRRLSIMGLEPERDLYRLLDEDLHIVPLPSEGLVLSAKLAEVLKIHVGDSVTIEALEGTRPTRQVPVTGLVRDFAGTSAYMDLLALNRLMREGDTITGVFLSVDTPQMPELHQQIKMTPRVAGVTEKKAALKSFLDTVAENLLRIRFFNILFAVIIAFGVVYNTARISLSERARELATLRVIGFTRAEISSILLGELAVLVVIGIPIGLLLGYGFAALTVESVNTEMIRLPLVVNPSTYGFAAVVVLIAALLSGLVVRRKLDHLDLVAVLKTKE
jgi:putative ABC transport system permease protein